MRHTYMNYIPQQIQIYRKSEYSCTLGKKTKKIINNDSAQIARMFNFEFNEVAENPEIDFYPLKSRDEIDPLIDLVADNLNDGSIAAS